MFIARHGDVFLIALNGEDFASPSSLEVTLSRIISRTGSAPLVLDITAVDEITDLGVATLYAADMMASNGGTRVAVAGARPCVHQMLVKSGAHMDLRIYTDVDQAVRALPLLPPRAAGPS